MVFILANGGYYCYLRIFVNPFFIIGTKIDLT
jgi:hypothetical protein